MPRLGSNGLAAKGGDRAVPHRLVDDPPDELAFLLWRHAEDARDGLADISVADRRRIGKTRFETRADRRHEVRRVSAAERAVHALALLQSCVGYFDRAAQWLAAAAVERAEIDRDGRPRRHRLAIEIGGAQGKRAGKAPERIVDEEPADVILRQQSFDGLRGQRLVAVR